MNMNDEVERTEFEKFAKKMRMSLCRNARKPHEYAFGTQKAWQMWMIRATIAQTEFQNKLTNASHLTPEEIKMLLDRRTGTRTTAADRKE